MRGFVLLPGLIASLGLAGCIPTRTIEIDESVEWFAVIRADDPSGGRMMKAERFNRAFSYTGETGWIIGYSMEALRRALIPAEVIEGLVVRPANDTDPTMPHPSWQEPLGDPEEKAPILTNDWLLGVASTTCIEACTSGSVCNTDRTRGRIGVCVPPLCRINHYVIDGICTECQIGLINPEGDDPLGTDTECRYVPCGRDYHVDLHRCVPCRAGTTNPAGDDPRLSDTECTEIICGVNQQVLYNQCIDCRPGSVSPAGLRAIGSNTECTEIICGREERVENHGCVPCAEGMENEAGDNATGPDTVCDGNICVQTFGVDCTTFNEAYIKPEIGGENDWFGGAVALANNNLMAIGAPTEHSGSRGIDGDPADDSSPYSGAVYIFERIAGSWRQAAFIKSSNSDAGDLFGTSVALSASTLVVGAPSEAGGARGFDGDQQSNSVLSSGAVYIFSREPTGWQQSAYFKGLPRQGAALGAAVSISDDLIAIGAPSSHTTYGGSVYVLRRTNGIWIEEARIVSPNSDSDDRFGYSVALSGDTLAIGASAENSSAQGINGTPTDNSLTQSGATYVYVRSPSGQWRLQAFIKASNPNRYDWFGHRVALFGDTLAVAAQGENSKSTGINGDQADNSLHNSGAVYVFVRSQGRWTQQAYIKASNTESRDVFSSIGLFADMLVVGSPGEDSGSSGIGGNQDDNSVQDSGAVYVFRRTGTAWAQAGYLKPSNPYANDDFGTEIALSESILAVGAPREAGLSTGINGDENARGEVGRGAVFVRRIAP